MVTSAISVGRRIPSASGRRLHRSSEARFGVRKISVVLMMAADNHAAMHLKMAGDDDTLHVAGSLRDLADAHIAVDPLDGIVRHIAVTAMDLYGIGTDAFGHLRRKELGHRCLRK